MPLCSRGALVLLLDQALNDLAHRHPGLVLGEVLYRARAEVHVPLLRPDYRHVLEEDVADLGAQRVRDPALIELEVVGLGKK